MSLEQALADNTAALKALTAALASNNPPATAPVPAQLDAEAAPEKKPKAVPAKPSSGKGEPAARDLDYGIDVKPKVIAAINAGKREEILTLLASFDVPSAIQLPKEKWGAFVAKLDELLAA